MKGWIKGLMLRGFVAVIIEGALDAVGASTAAAAAGVASGVAAAATAAADAVVDDRSHAARSRSAGGGAR